MMMLPREDSIQFQSAAQMMAHYAEVRRRIRDRNELPPPPPKVLMRPTRPYDPRQYDERPARSAPIVYPENHYVGRLRYIVRATAFVRHISVADIADPGRQEWRVHARWLCWSIIKELTGRSLPDIGRALPGRQFDHTTVLY